MHCLGAVHFGPAYAPRAATVITRRFHLGSGLQQSTVAPRRTSSDRRQLHGRMEAAETTGPGTRRSPAVPLTTAPRVWLCAVARAPFQTMTKELRVFFCTPECHRLQSQMRAVSLLLPQLACEEHQGTPQPVPLCHGQAGGTFRLRPLGFAHAHEPRPGAGRKLAE
ncbi:unnamed protein product [Cutaneotrichosporon oleaginosum]